jgi:hypothetical protein
MAPTFNMLSGRSQCRRIFHRPKYRKDESQRSTRCEARATLKRIVLSSWTADRLARRFVRIAGLLFPKASLGTLHVLSSTVTLTEG